MVRAYPGFTTPLPGLTFMGTACKVKVDGLVYHHYLGDDPSCRRPHLPIQAGFLLRRSR